MMTWTLTVCKNLTKSNTKDPEKKASKFYRLKRTSPQSHTRLSSSIKVLVRIQLISVTVILHSKTTEAQWTQHGVGYDGQCCIPRPDGLFGSATVLATWWICIHFLHGQHEPTDPSLPLGKKTRTQSRLRQTAKYHAFFYSLYVHFNQFFVFSSLKPEV